jgi:outer membrane protein assembly factor BamB
LCWLVAIVAGLTLMISTGLWNPFPGLWEWLNKSRPLSDPLTTWQERLGGVPRNVTVLEKYVVIEHADSVEVRNRTTGRKLWQAKSDWAAVAAGTVVSGTLLKKGYEVRDAGTGAVLRRDDKASAVWTYTNAMLDISCFAPKDCELVARNPADGAQKWKVMVPGMGFVLFADNPGLAGAELFTAEPVPLPTLLGFPIDGRIRVVDTSSGRLLRSIEPERNTAVYVLADRVIYSIAKPRNGRCVVTISGREGNSAAEVWRRDGYQLVSTTGGGCDQRGQPKAGGNAVVAIRPDGNQSLLDANDGREVLTCADGEKILSTDGIYAVVQSADGSRITGYLLGRAKPLWTREANPKVSVAVSRTAVVVMDHSPDRIIVLDPATGKVRSEVRSGAEVVAHDAAGLILADRRELGYLALGGSQS